MTSEMKESLKRHLHYILDENKNATPANFMDWANFFEKTENRIVNQEEIKEHQVSTVFLGLDHNWNPKSNVPLIFETMVFEPNSYSEIYCTRYSTWNEAEEGHKKAVQWVKEGCKHE